MRSAKKLTAAICSAAIAMSAAAVNVSAAAQKSWQDIYAAMLREEIDSPAEYPDGFEAFSIYDINADGTPELIVSSDEFYGCRIYTVSGGKAVSLGTAGSRGECACIPSKKYLVGSNIMSGYFYADYFRINGTELKEAITFSDNSGAAFVDEDNAEYNINGKKVSSKEYYSKLSDIQTYGSVALGRTFMLTENSIEYAVTGSKDYKTAYGSFIKDSYLDSIYREKTDTFTLMDITGDKTPELIILCGNDTDIYTFRDGRVQLLADGSPYPVGVYEVSRLYGISSEKGIFMIKASPVSGKGEGYTFYSTAGNNVLMKARFSSGIDPLDGKYIYTVNGKTVSKQKYKKELKKYTSIKYSAPKKTYTISEENIKKALC